MSVANKKNIGFDELPYCCGVTLVGDFGGTDLTSGRNVSIFSEKDFEAELKRAEKSSYSEAMMLATVNDEQYYYYHKVFKKLGWKCVRKGRNGLHGTTVYLLVKVLKPVK